MPRTIEPNTDLLITNGTAGQETGINNIGAGAGTGIVTTAGANGAANGTVGRGAVGTTYQRPQPILLANLQENIPPPAPIEEIHPPVEITGINEPRLYLETGTWGRVDGMDLQFSKMKTFEYACPKHGIHGDIFSLYAEGETTNFCARCYKEFLVKNIGILNQVTCKPE